PIVRVQLSGLTGVIGIAAGDDFSMALRTDGNVWAWGSNWYGQLGDGTNTNSNVPVQVSGLTDAIRIAAGECLKGHSLAVKTDGTVWAWGWNGYGQLGNGTITDSNVPVQVNGLTGAIG